MTTRSAALNRCFCPLIVALVLSSVLAVADAEKAATVPASPANADQLYRSGKFAEAEAAFRALLNVDAKLVTAQVGLTRSLLRQQKVDESLQAVNAALVAQPNSAALLAARGDVQFRRGEMAPAEESYLAANTNNPKEARAYLGLARIYRAYSLYRKSFDALQKAHEIAPDDPEVNRQCLAVLPRKRRLAAIRAYLAAPHPDDAEETRAMQEYLDFLEATLDTPIHACRLVSKVDQTETKLEPFLQDISHVRGIGLTVKLNGQNSRLLLDTGAGGIIIGRKLAEKAGIARVSSSHYGGVGDRGMQSGYRAVVDRIRIGELEFQDCVVSVSENKFLADQNGLIGTDVFSAYLVNIDLPDMRLKLSPLPKRPEDAAAPTALNSEGEEQDDDEQKVTSKTAAEQSTANEPFTIPPQLLPKDRYIAPEMVNWTRVFRFGHNILVPTNVNGSASMFFILDTGASMNLISTRAGQQVAKMTESSARIRGVNGTVKDVFSAQKAALQFGHFRQENLDILSIDLSNTSRRIETEISGFLGYSTLRMFEVKIDYRDGLVDFVYDPKVVNRLRP